MSQQPPATPKPAMKSFMTDCERAFSEWILEQFGATSKVTGDPKLSQAFRAGWYADKGSKK